VRFRTIQVRHEDILTALLQADRAADRPHSVALLAVITSGTSRTRAEGGSPHVSHKTAGVHHDARRRGSRMAARGTRAATSDAGDQDILNAGAGPTRSIEEWERFVHEKMFRN